MSELKPYIGPHPTDHTLTDYYLKSEADKVIKELIEKNERLANKDKIMTSKTIKDMFKELRHNKFKRCVAMARWCESEAYIHEHGSDYDEDLVAWFGKWHKRWRELAEKFKEAK